MQLSLIKLIIVQLFYETKFKKEKKKNIFVGLNKNFRKNVRILKSFDTSIDRLIVK